MRQDLLVPEAVIHSHYQSVRRESVFFFHQFQILLTHLDRSLSIEDKGVNSPFRKTGVDVDKSLSLITIQQINNIFSSILVFYISTQPKKVIRAEKLEVVF